LRTSRAGGLPARAIAATREARRLRLALSGQSGGKGAPLEAPSFCSASGEGLPRGSPQAGSSSLSEKA
jgi:hypothetical protein